MVYVPDCPGLRCDGPVALVIVRSAYVGGGGGAMTVVWTETDVPFNVAELVTVWLEPPAASVAARTFSVTCPVLPRYTVPSPQLTVEPLAEHAKPLSLLAD